MKSVHRLLCQRLSMRVFAGAVIILASLVVCDPALAQISAHDKEIAKVDAAIDRLLTKQRVNRQARDEINGFAREASNWFEAAGNKGKEVAEIQRQIRDRDYSTMNDGQLQSALQTLQKEQAAIFSPPGGRLIQGRRYANLQQLQNGMSSMAKDLVVLNKEYDTLSRELLRLDAVRDSLVDDRRTHNALDGKLLDELKTQYNQIAKDMNDNTKWCERGVMHSGDKLISGPAVCTERRLGMLAIVEYYKNQLQKSGKPFSQEELANRIKAAQQISNTVKREMEQEILPGIKEQIIHLQEVQQRQERPGVELAGCWLVPKPGGGQPAVLTITKAGGQEYKGTLTKSGWIGLPDGHVLCMVARINENTFDGTEYSIINNVHTQTRLRLIVGHNRQSASYRTRDDMISLIPCR